MTREMSLIRVRQRLTRHCNILPRQSATGLRGRKRIMVNSTSNLSAHRLAYLATTGLGSILHSQQALPRHHSSAGSALVSIRVKWVPHPEDEVMYDHLQQSWLFTVKRVSLALSHRVYVKVIFVGSTTPSRSCSCRPRTRRMFWLKTSCSCAVESRCLLVSVQKDLVFGTKET